VKGKKFNKKELKALVALLDDDDGEVVEHVEEKIRSLGHEVIQHLEKHWETSFNPIVQKKLEDLIHSMQFSRLVERLKVWKDSENQDLLEGMWLAATYLYPDLDYSRLKKDLEQIFYDVWLEFKTDALPIEQVKILNSVLFDKLKFKPNSKNFHAVSNSMINRVMETQKGNPLSLCAIYLMVAQKLKMPVYGVNLPNLFILVYKTEKQQFYINAFNRGIIFTREDIDNYIAHLNLTPMDLFYEPCTNKDIIRRLMRNLMASFDKIGDHEKSEEIKLLLQSITEGNEIDY
jgi:regulator of sirC expression with transglutaminase-like and TPR domain